MALLPMKAPGKRWAGVAGMVSSAREVFSQRNKEKDHGSHPLQSPATQPPRTTFPSRSQISHPLQDPSRKPRPGGIISAAALTHHPSSLLERLCLLKAQVFFISWMP